MSSIREYREVPGDTLEALGVQDVMRTPVDGVDRNTWMSWNTARLAVGACFVDDGEMPSHMIVVNNADGAGASTAFDAEILAEGSVRVCTVSGGSEWAVLNDQQSAAFQSLIEASIASGLKY